jgi:alpha-N-arabinofuranosidase
MLISMINHADRVKIACIAQLVNVIGPIMTEPMGAAWRQTIFYPFSHCSNFGRGTALKCVVDAPSYSTESRDEVSELMVAATHADGLTLFAVNRSLTDDLETTFDLRGFDVTGVSATVTRHDDMDAVNIAADQFNVKPETNEDFTISEGLLTIRLPKLSWNVIQLKLSN